MIRVVDASVALKWFVEEDGSRQAAALLTGGDSLIAPDLIVPEVCNACWKLVRRQLMRPAQQQLAIARLPMILDELVPTSLLAHRSVAIANQLDHPAYDCFYLVLAEQRSGTLITADRRLIDRVSGTAWQESVIDLRTITEN